MVRGLEGVEEGDATLEAGDFVEGDGGKAGVVEGRGEGEIREARVQGAGREGTDAAAELGGAGAGG